MTNYSYQVRIMNGFKDINVVNEDNHTVIPQNRGSSTASVLEMINELEGMIEAYRWNPGKCMLVDYDQTTKKGVSVWIELGTVGQ